MLYLYSTWKYLCAFALAYSVLCTFTYIKKRRVQKPKDKHVTESLSVVFPCFGSYDEEVQFKVWDKYLVQKYDGPIDYLFVVESEEDMAFTHIRNYLSKKNLYKPNEFASFGSNRRVTLRIAPIQYHCSQKIKNMVVGARGQKTEYLLMMDDDMSVHDYTFQEMVSCIRGKKAFSTGYTVEIAGSKNIASQMVASYRSTLLFGFVFENAGGMWGGCQCMRMQDYLDLDVETQLIKGGYSDDGLIQAIARNNGYKVIAPETSMFLNRVEDGRFAKKYLNYVMRQYATLNCYLDFRTFVLVNFQRICLLSVGFFTLATIGSIIYQLIRSLLAGQVNELVFNSLFFFGYLSWVGFFQNLEISAFYQICERMTGNSMKIDMNPPLSGFSFHAHFLFTPFIIIYTLFASGIRWGIGTYYIHGGKVAYATRPGKPRVSYEDSIKEFYNEMTPKVTEKTL